MVRTFPDAAIRSQRDRFRLEDEQVREFERAGFLAGLELLDDEEVAMLRERLEGVVDRLEELEPQLYEVEAAWLERPGEVVLHFLGAWLVDEVFHDLVSHPGVTVPVAQALGVRRLRFFHDQVFHKPARHPGVVPWHQDYSYWTRTAPAAHATLFITLDDMGPENGGLEYVPGSHRWGLLPPQSFGGDLDALHEHLNEEQRRAFQPQSIRLRAGQAAIHHSHLIHGSRANPSDRPRRAVALNYMAEGTRVANPGPLLRGVPTIPVGEPVAGDHFPLVLDLDA